MKKNLKIGITGGIGSGKSLVTAFLEKKGYPVLKSDQVAKDLMSSDEAIMRKIVNEFGANSYNGKVLNKSYLAENVFSDQEKVQRINSIVHPPTTRKIDELTKQLFAKHQLVFVESALIFEAEIQNRFDFVILVFSEEQARIARVLKRDKISQTDVEKRMAFQIPDNQKKELADFVIENNSSIPDLEKRVQFILTVIKSFLI